MGLLHWCTVSPSSGLAAIRFTAPIRVSFIRIFPAGFQPFSQFPGVVAQTEPAAFFLDVFFNAQPLHPAQPDSKEKQRAANALVPSTIAYAGGPMEFSVDMGTEYATRLMIVKGEFETLSIGIYGEIVTENLPLPEDYEPKPQPSVEPFPLSRSVDPSASADPTQLAASLLSLIPQSPPLALVTRLMFCLKPSNEDWDHPDFPYLYADLDVDVDGFDLEKALRCTTRPVPDDVSYESLATFALKVVESIGPKSSDQAYLMAKLLSVAAPQHPDMARTILQKLDISSIFTVHNLEESTVLRLLDASTNADIARYFNNDFFLGMLHDVQGNPGFDKRTQLAAGRLSNRIHQWHVFEDALSNTRGDFRVSAQMLKDIGNEEHALGSFLQTMMNHDNVVAKLAENPVLPSQSHPPLLLHSTLTSVSHGDFITFVRAFIGVSSVLAVWAWADSLGNDECREQTLAVIRLWQGVDGYREVVNHLLLLRQLTRRLEWIIAENDPPRHSGLLGEQILADLVQEPRTILRDDLVQTILSLEPPLSFIPEHERLPMRKVALVSEDGLPAAIEELTLLNNHPLSLRRLRTLRVSLAIVEQKLEEDDGEWQVLKAMWEEGSHGLVPRLVEIFTGVTDDLNGHFLVTAPPPRMNQALVSQLFRIADVLLQLLDRLTPAFPLTSRALHNLAVGVADVFACTDAADTLFSQSSLACISAQGTRQTCLDLVRALSGPSTSAEPGKVGAEVVLRALLQHGTHSSGRDPVYHLLQVFTLIDHVIPEPNPEGEDSYWMTSVFPYVLPELREFFRLLDPDNKVHVVRRLVRLDDGVIGIGEWLLTEELKHLGRTLASASDPAIILDRRLVGQHDIFLSLRFLLNLVIHPSATSAWCIRTISSVPDAARHTNTCLMTLLDGYFTSVLLTRLIRTLTVHSASFDPDLRFALVLGFLRTVQTETWTAVMAPVFDTLKSLPLSAIMPDLLRLELGRALSAIAQSTVDPENCETVLAILEWVSSQDNPKLTVLSGITTSVLLQLYEKLVQTAPERVQEIKLKISIDEDETNMGAAEPIELPETLELTLHSLENLLRPSKPNLPSTPAHGTNTPDILGLVISPGSLLRSPAATGLTKTYAKNDFRQLRQVPSARLNTSRLPSMHGTSALLSLLRPCARFDDRRTVDEFELGLSPTLPVSDMVGFQI